MATNNKPTEADHLRLWLEALRRERRWKVLSDIATASQGRVTIAALSQLMNGGTKRVKDTTVEALAIAFGMTFEDVWAIAMNGVASYPSETRQVTLPLEFWRLVDSSGLSSSQYFQRLIEQSSQPPASLSSPNFPAPDFIVTEDESV